MKQALGTSLILLGVLTGIAGALVNDLGMHLLAIQLWTYGSNLFMVLWAIGYDQKWWNSQMSIRALIVLWSVYEIGGILALCWWV